MFERFTDRARRVIVLAQSEARLLNHNYIGTEHVLLGLINEGEGVAARALKALGIPFDEVREEVIKIIGEGTESPTGHIPFTPRAKKVLEMALREALNMGHSYIGTEHILLGLVREGEGVGAQVLAKMGADLDKVRHQVIESLSGYSGSPEAEATASGEISSSAPKEPSCPRCRKPLAETAAYRVMVVPDAEREGEKSTVTIVFCTQCGTSLGTLA